MARRKKAWYGARVRPRGLCPKCLRNMALMVGFRWFHREFLPDGPKCPGRGEIALPLPEGGEQ